MTATTEPTEIRAGDLTEWNKDLPVYPASEWTLVYTLINASSKITITASASSDTHAVSEPAATTAAWSAGFYTWTAQVTNITDALQKHTVLAGNLDILPDLTAAGTTTYDGRSYAKITLDAIEAVIQNRASKDQMSYTIHDRQLSRMSVDDLFKFRDQFRGEVANEDATQEGVSGKKVVTVF
ncbi:hypothetical protein K0U83_09595 [bacterium]|nr:hypothetical protein [bacterium]